MLLDCYKDPRAFWSTARIQWKSRERQFFLCHLGTRGLACIPELDLGYSKLGICLNFAIPIEGFYFLVNSRRHEVVVVVVVGGGVTRDLGDWGCFSQFCNCLTSPYFSWMIPHICNTNWDMYLSLWNFHGNN